MNLYSSGFSSGTSLELAINRSLLRLFVLMSRGGGCIGNQAVARECSRLMPSSIDEVLSVDSSPTT